MPPRSSSLPAPEDRGRRASRAEGAAGVPRGLPGRATSSPPSVWGSSRGGPQNINDGPPTSFRARAFRGRVRAPASMPPGPVSARTGANTMGSGPASARPPSPATSTRALPDTSAGTTAPVTTVGVKRASFGTSGRSLNVHTNHFVTSIPEGNIYHYDGASSVSFFVMTRLRE